VLGIRVYVPSKYRDDGGYLEGICEIMPATSTLDPCSGLPSWRSNWRLVPHTRGVHPDLPMAATNAVSLPYMDDEIRVFFWDENGLTIRNVWYTRDQWQAPFSEETVDVPGGAGHGMDAICWFDPVYGPCWSCFYSDGEGDLFEFTFSPRTRSSKNTKIGTIDSGSHIRAYARREEGDLH
jgi:hypothetical protein